MREIICFEVPSFEVALARLEDPLLRSRPVAIASQHTSRTIVHEVSPEAQSDGLRPGMPLDHARRLCPTLQVLPPDPARASLAQQQLQEVVSRFAPIWEPVRPGHLFLDMTGTARLFGPSVDTAARIAREVAQRQGLTGVIGVASNKLVSRVAAKLIEPPQLYDVRPGSERLFLAPLPVGLLPGLGGAQARTILALLEDLNLSTWGEIAAVPVAHLELVLGPPAGLLHDWARGIDPSPVLPPVQQPRLEVALMLEPDEVDDDRLLGRLYGLLEQLCRTLRQQQRVCGRLTLTIMHSDHIEISRHQKLIPRTYWEVEMFPYLKAMFFRCFQRRVRIRKMAIRAEALGAPEEQLLLFDMQTPGEQATAARARHLALALDRLRERFGEQAVWWGTQKRDKAAAHKTVASPKHYGKTPCAL